MKRTILLVGAFFLALGAAAQMPFDVFERDDDIARLLEKSDGVGLLRVQTAYEAYVCTVFAVDAHYWLSAGHCAPSSSESEAKAKLLKLRAKLDAETYMVRPQGSIPTPADVSAPPITIDGGQARFVKSNDKFSLFYRVEPVRDYFRMAPGAQASSKIWVYSVRARKSGFNAIQMVKLPQMSALLNRGPYDEYDVIVQGGAMNGFSGSPYIAKAGGEYFAVGLLDAVAVSLYVMYYLELPIIATAESPFSLGFSLNTEEIGAWIAEDSAEN